MKDDTLPAYLEDLEHNVALGHPLTSEIAWIVVRRLKRRGITLDTGAGWGHALTLRESQDLLARAQRALAEHRSTS